MLENINFILDIINGKVEELIYYNQLLDHLEAAQESDIAMDEELFKLRDIIGTKVLQKPQILIGRAVGTMSKLSGRLGRLLLKPSL